MLNTQTATAEQVADFMQRLSNRELSELWTEVAEMTASTEVNMVQDWVSDEVLRRVGDDLFDTWLLDFDADGNPVAPIEYLRKA